MSNIKGFKELEPNTLVRELIQYIEKELPSFPTSQEFKDNWIKKNEDKYSSVFVIFMTNQCKSNFYFKSENPQKGSHTIDIGVYKGSVLIFTIEAKILPTPKPRIEHEYVYGKGAGIQRFKECKHGLDNSNNPLPESGMLAYIKDNDYDYYHKKVNQWILDATWDKSEQLEKISFNAIGKLKSKHKRISDSSEFILHHFWIKVPK